MNTTALLAAVDSDPSSWENWSVLADALEDEGQPVGFLRQIVLCLRGVNHPDAKVVAWDFERREAIIQGHTCPWVARENLFEDVCHRKWEIWEHTDGRTFGFSGPEYPIWVHMWEVTVTSPRHDVFVVPALGYDETDAIQELLDEDLPEWVDNTCRAQVYPTGMQCAEAGTWYRRRGQAWEKI